MNTALISRMSKLAVVTSAAALLGACAITPKTTEDQVMTRAQARWDLLVAKDFKKSYAYMAPSYRALVSESDYIKKFGKNGHWNSVAVHSANCKPERCQVKVLVEATLMIPIPGARLGNEQKISSYSDEPWVREDSQWWFYEAP